MRTWFLVAATTCFACTQGNPSMLIEVSSTLAIPTEVDSLVARVLTVDGTKVLQEQSYTLGSPPNDVWPQTLPIVAGETSPTDFALVVELRKSRAGAPSDVLGFASAQARFPEIGTRKVPLPVPRVCADEDFDEYGIGLGCIGSDCDDTRNDVPTPNGCELLDAGVPADVGTADAGVRDGGPRPCFPDGGNQCGPEMVCVPTGRNTGRCAPACDDPSDCNAASQTCLPQIGACFCRIPCRAGGTCGPYTCRDGCCELH